MGLPDPEEERGDQAKDTPDEAGDKTWNSEISLLVFGPKSPKGSEPIQSRKIDEYGPPIEEVLQ